MGVNLKELFSRQEVAIEDLKGKTIAVDAFNTLFQFLATIRSREGGLLTDSKGRVTSHLIGLFTRTTHLMNAGINLVFVFDGKPPVLKQKERARRQEIKQAAQKAYERAVAAENVEEMRKYAARTTTMNEEIVRSAQELLSLLGIPIINAPSEGEAQAAYLVKKKDAWAVASQDYDALVNGASRVIQNLSIAGRRKHPKTLAYTTVAPEIIELEPNLKRLGITQEQLVMIALLVGTDYNPGGIKGIGPKTAVKLVRKHSTPEDLFNAVGWDEKNEVSWRELWRTINEIPVTDEYTINFGRVNAVALKKFLVDERNFGAERVEKTLKLLKMRENKGLSSFF